MNREFLLFLFSLLSVSGIIILSVRWSKNSSSGIEQERKPDIEMVIKQIRQAGFDAFVEDR